MSTQGFPQPFNLSTRVALVTGAASGIGYAIASLFIEQGAKVALVDKDPAVIQAAETLVSAVGEAFGVCIDITSRPNLEVLVEESEQRLGGIDILVNNAGIGPLQPAALLSDANWDRTFQINLKAPFMLSQLVGQKMIERGRGKIINIASQAGIVALPEHAAYCASKAAIISLTKVLALEWGPLGVNTNAISPTVVLTKLGKVVWDGEKGEALKAKIPTRRFALPEEVAAAALFLASDAANMINGENLVVDGGYTIQ